MLRASVVKCGSPMPLWPPFIGRRILPEKYERSATSPRRLGILKLTLVSLGNNGRSVHFHRIYFLGGSTRPNYFYNLRLECGSETDGNGQFGL